MNNANTEIKRWGIVVIQSLPITNKQTGRILYDEILRYKEVSQKDSCFCKFYDVQDKSGFYEVINEINNDLSEGDIVTLHIETHGDEEGIVLSSDDCIPWKEFYNLIRPINIKIGHLLFVVMAMCDSHAMISSIDPYKRAPYRAFICTTCKVSEDEILRCFEAFYGDYNNMLDVCKGLTSLRIEENGAEKGSHFKLLSAEAVFKETLLSQGNMKELAITQLHSMNKKIDEDNIRETSKEIQNFLRETYEKTYGFYNFKDLYE